MKRHLKQWVVALIMVLLLSCTGYAVAETEEKTIPYSGKIVFLHTNDTHGAIEKTDDTLGLASAAKMKQDLEDEGCYVLLLDAGDFASGTSLVRSTKGTAAVKGMKAAGYDAACIGDSEFDYGYPQLKALADCADFPFLAANVNTTDESGLQSHTIFTAPDGTKIGVFGLVTPEVNTSLHPAKIKGVTVLADDALISCAKEQVAALQTADCDLIVCLGHLGTDAADAGNRSIDVIREVDGIDLFIDGHSHKTITTEDANHKIDDTVLVSAGSSFEKIGMVTYVGTTYQSSELYGVKKEGIPWYDGSDSEVKELVSKDTEAFTAKERETFAESKVSLTREKAVESNLGDLVTDAMFWAAHQLDSSVDASILDSGSLNASLPAGDLTRETVRAVLSGEGDLRIITVTGEELLEALEAATQAVPAKSDAFPQVRNIQYVVDTNVAFQSGKPGRRVRILSVNDRKFDPAATYTIATSDSLAKGTGAYAAFSDAKENWDLRIPLEEAVIDYIAEELAGKIGTGYAEPKGRVTVIRIPFTDVSTSDWYFDAVQYVYEENIMKGMSERTFDPQVSMSRAMLVTMLYRLNGSPSVRTPASVCFADVDDNAWYADAVVWAVEQGITSGVGDRRFAPNEALDRQQMATFFYRYIKHYLDPGVTDRRELPYYDTVEIADWALDAVAYCTDVGLLQGMGNHMFAPHTAANRAMGATVFMRFMQLA